jgi:hypothetical protein
MAHFLGKEAHYLISISNKLFYKGEPKIVTCDKIDICQKQCP